MTKMLFWYENQSLPSFSKWMMTTLYFRLMVEIVEFSLVVPPSHPPKVWKI